MGFGSVVIYYFLFSVPMNSVLNLSAIDFEQAENFPVTPYLIEEENKTLNRIRTK
jgi:hypothetical protein